MTETSTPAFVNRNSGPEFLNIALRGTILQTQVGSGVHGVTVSSEDDRDEMGICIPPPSHVVGLQRFEQYEYRTQPMGIRSGPGDLDLSVYALQKWARLAIAGNPTVLLPLFVGGQDIVSITDLGRSLRGYRSLFLSRHCGRKTLGYLNRQRSLMLGEIQSTHTNRPELIEKFGFDTKFAYHMVRLGVQGVELLSTGAITLPMPEPWRSDLTALRRGERTQDWALEAVRELEDQLVRLTKEEGSVLPPEVNVEAVDQLLRDLHFAHWGAGSYRR
jgi:uncharacterized protein